MKKLQKKKIGFKPVFTLALAACLGLFLLTGCSSPTPKADVADTVIKSSNIYTVAQEETMAGMIAIKGNQIVALGTEEEVKGYIGDTTKLIDVGEQFVMPGFIEGHTHSEAHWGTIGVNLTNVPSKDQCGELIKTWADANPDAPWVFGALWYAANWGGADPTKEDLDKYVSDRPVALMDFDGHNLWCNSKALELAGITKETAKELSVGGEIVVDPKTGEPTGYIKEQPMYPIMALVPPIDNLDSFKEAIDIWTKKGITSVNEMSLNKPKNLLMTQLTELEAKDELNVRHFVPFDLQSTEAELKEGLALYKSDLVKLTSVKAFLDGVGSVMTAAMLQPYEGTDITGDLLMTEEELTAGFIQADNLGLSGRVHACGDKAVRTALNAYETMIATNGEKDRRSSIEHLDTVAPQDLPRFGELKLLTNLTPDFMAPTLEWKDNPYLQVYDPKIESELWLLRSLIDNGATVTFGTDSFYSAMDPFVQIYRSIARVSNDGQPVGGYMPQEAVTMKEAIKFYTYNPAFEAGMESKLGTLEVGKYADIIVLDQNLLTVDVNKIRDTQVMLTMMNGKIVHQQ